MQVLKEYEQLLTGGSGKMGRNLNKDFSSWIELHINFPNFYYFMQYNYQELLRFSVY
jgi:hypothetical protein